jgi:predicted nuclease with RNAse H fold
VQVLYVGIDLGQRRVHVVALDAQLSLGDARVVDVEQLSSLGEILEWALVIAIDAPEALSTAPHADDESLPPKFRSARCAEIALGREHGIWVPWVTPTIDRPLSPWMHVGLRVFELAKASAAQVVEVFPHAGFRILSGGGIPSKQTAEGLRVRAELLKNRGVAIEALEMWSHDSLDALLAASVAYDVGQGTGVRVGCGHDASAIYLPAAVGPAAPAATSPE